MKMAGSTEETEFLRQRLAYLENIGEDLREAISLMSKLNSNLQVWAERTGEEEALNQVWGMFINRMTSISGILSTVQKKEAEEA